MSSTILQISAKAFAKPIFAGIIEESRKPTEQSEGEDCGETIIPNRPSWATAFPESVL
jgi:hypothetical protein